MGAVLRSPPALYIMERVLSIRRNRDNTVTIRGPLPSGRKYVEHVGLDGKSLYEQWEAVRVAVMTAGFRIPDDDLYEMWRGA